ncbi:MAG: lipoate--protein ligase [Clostridiales Family XIII bacterium]|jgi:lipoate-protein ligase A|nr:lipoate--protein ligase [Clostridiales Family XIII bacterium]
MSCDGTQSAPRAAAYWFAAEEVIMRDRKPQAPVYLLWRTPDTVMLGANQVAEQEIDGAYAEAHGIAVVRRSSGGGTIFTDPGTVLYTILLPWTPAVDPKDVVREHLAAPVTEALARLGAEARLEGRNDILLAGKKFSGIAQYIKHGYLCSHGSLLWDADIAKLARVLTADEGKIASKALRSVSARVTNIADHVREKDVNAFLETLHETFRAHSKAPAGGFTEAEQAAIGTLMQEKYENPAWTYGRAPAYTYANGARFPGGRVDVFLDVRRGVIEDCRIAGDFLALRPVAEIETALKGVPHQTDALRRAISVIDVRGVLGSVSAEEFLSVL